MPANKKTIAGMARSYTVVIMPLNNPGHAALRKGRVSVSNGVYLVTATTTERIKLFETFTSLAQHPVVSKTGPCWGIRPCSPGC